MAIHNHELSFFSETDEMVDHKYRCSDVPRTYVMHKIRS